MATRKSGGIPVTNSMFACLKLEDEMEEEKKSKRRRNQQNQNDDTSTSNKKKDDKRKKNANESKQLQQLAFGKPASRKKSGKNSNTNNARAQEQKQNWDEWKEHDKEVVEDQYKNDLEKAIMASQLQLEQDKSVQNDKKAVADAGEELPKTREERKKKKQKDKAKPMSLEEFKQLQPAAPKHSDDSDEGEPAPPPIHYRVPTGEQDDKFFNNVHDEAKQILRQDRMQEEYRKTYAVDNAVVAKLKNDIEIRDKTVAELKQQVEQMQAEMKQVKHRNKQLCVILAQGEMKDKAQVLLQVDDLNNVKDELTEQVTSLTVELEKEKSKNRALKAESDKLKAGKHGK